MLFQANSDLRKVLSQNIFDFLTRTYLCCGPKEVYCYNVNLIINLKLNFYIFSCAAKVTISYYNLFYEYQLDADLYISALGC